MCMGIDYFEQTLKFFNSTMIVLVKNEKLNTGDTVTYSYGTYKTICDGIIIKDELGFERTIKNIDILNLQENDLPTEYKNKKIMFTENDCDKTSANEQIWIYGLSGTFRYDGGEDVFSKPLILERDISLTTQKIGDVM